MKPTAPILSLAIFLLVSLPGITFADEGKPATGPVGDGEFQRPALRVPKMTAPPVIDGKIDAAEWGRAASFTGVAAVGSGTGPYTLVPQVQQVRWWIGWDDQFLYLAMHSPHPKGTWPRANVKRADDGFNLLFDDHTEIQICAYDWEKANTPPYGFYKIMNNAKDVVSDQHLNNGTPGTEDRWDFGGNLKSLVTDEAWSLEMRIPLKNMQVDKLDGRSLTVQLVRTDSCVGTYFAGWTPYPWKSWDRFARVEFDAKAPVVSLNKIGEVMAGDLDAEVVVAAGDVPREIEATLTVEDASGKPLFKEKRSASLASGEKKPLVWKAAGLPVTAVDISEPRRNHFEILATYRDGAAVRTLYHNRSPFMKLNDDFRTKFLDPWVRGRPKGEWLARIASLPYSNKLAAAVDLDFFGLDAAVTSARRFSVEVTDEGGKKLGAGTRAIEHLKSGPLYLDLDQKKDGTYTATFSLLDDGGRTVAEKKMPFLRKNFPWEHNSLGTDNEVIPPYMPIRTNDAVLKTREMSFPVGKDHQDRLVQVWGRSLLIGDNGLIEQAHIAPPTGTYGEPVALLQSPMTLQAVINGKQVVGKGKHVSFTETAPHRVSFTADQELGPLTASLRGTVEYDGWYQAALTFSGDAAAEALDLVIDLRNSADAPVDTLYVQRQGGARYGNCIMGIPEKTGVAFRSTDLVRPSRGAGGHDWRSFVPNVFIGGGDRGLQFHAWQDTGWETSDTDPMTVVERLPDGTARLRIRFISGAHRLAGRPPLEFAFQFLPVKPNQDRYRTLLSEGRIYHETPGWRYYGDSVDGFALHSPEDFQGLRKYLLYGWDGTGKDWKTQYWPQAAQNRFLPIHNGAQIIMYGSTELMGAGMEEFASFGGEWMGDNNWKPNRGGASCQGWWNMGGTRQWTTDEQLSVVEPNWTRSLTDAYLWYHKPLMEKCGFNGTWWDDSNLGTIMEYDPALGREAEKWNMLQRRELTKRLNVLGWQLMRPPAWIQHAHTDYAWTQFFWMVEGDYYADNKDMTALEQMPMDEWRGMTRTRSTMLVPIPWLRGYAGTTPALDRKIKRSVAAVCLSHDILSGSAEDQVHAPDLFRRLQFAVDISDTKNCLYRGYWRTADAIQPAGKEIYTTVYHNQLRRTAVAVILNGWKGHDQALGGTSFDPAALLGQTNTPRIKRLYDLETGAPIAYSVDNGRYRITDELFVPWHDFRLVALETE